MAVYFQNQKVRMICQIRDTTCLTKKQKKKKNPQNKTHQKNACEAPGHYLVETVMCKLHCGTF